ncbi:MAG TPA: LytTR family DNA-binding domain-containing protein [Bacteroidales bacterium]|nr:LytTR family DNA-binding domain-containing protein [Bacteroidales bacterium]
MNCIIVDDDQLSRKVLSEHIRKSSFLYLSGAYDNAIEARNILTGKTDIDLVFLDIQMPDMDGFELLNSLERPPAIIMVTTNEKMAVKAYDLDVIDYLIKPVSYSRFCKAVDKVIRNQNKNIRENVGQQEVFIKKGSTLVKLKLIDIVAVEALENYVVVHTDKEKYTIHFTMKAIEQQLPSLIFVRVHRSYIVNKSRIEMIRDNSVELSGEPEISNIPIGKSYRDSLLKEINVMLR